MKPHFSLRRALLIPALAAAVLAASGCQFPTAPYRVGVMDFDNALNDPSTAGLSRSLAELMTANLTADPRIAVIERDDVINASLRVVPGTRRIERNTSNLRRVGRRIGADYLIVGSITQLETTLILNARLFSVRTGTAVPGASQTKYGRRLEDLYPLIQNISRFMAHQVGMRYDARRVGGQTPAAGGP